MIAPRLAPVRPGPEVPFRLEPAGDVTAEPLQIRIGSLKALFFVKNYDGDASRRDDPGFDPGGGQGRKILVMFEDGERIFVSREAVKRVEWVTREAAAGSARR